MGFKDFMTSFLYENVEDEDDDVLEEEPKETKTQPAPAPAPEPVQTPAAPVQTVAENIPAQDSLQSVNPYAVDSQTDAFLNEQTQEEQGGSFLSRIDMDMDQEEETARPVRRVQNNVRRSAQRSKPQRTLPRENYEAVISPIFGNLPEEKKNKDALHDAINLPKPVETVDMVEVISPMYGAEHVTIHTTPRVKKAAPRGNDLPATQEEIKATELMPEENEAAAADLASYLIGNANAAEQPKPAAKSGSHHKGAAYKTRKGSGRK